MVVLASTNENIQPLQLSEIDMFFLTIKKENQLTIKDIDNSIRIESIYREFISLKQRQFGLNVRMWNEELLKKVQAEFNSKYIG